MTFFWSIGRVLRGALGLSANLSLVELITEIGSSREIDFVTTVIFILVLLLSEVVCIFLVLDYSFITLFLLDEEDTDSEVSNASSFIS